MKPPQPPNIKYSHDVVYCNLLGIFNIRGGGGLILGEGMNVSESNGL